MMKQPRLAQVKLTRLVMAVVIAAGSVVSTGLLRPVSAVACALPGTDYGTVTITANVAATGAYTIWTRMAAPNSTDTFYRLEVDGATCFDVGGASVPVYASGSTTRFADNNSNWISVTTSGAAVQMSLNAGSHTFKLIGMSEGVVIDRVIATVDTTCVPKGGGDNCATGHVASDINKDAKVDFLDFSALAKQYNKSDATIGRSDVNSDGTVDFLDLSVLASAYGQ